MKMRRKKGFLVVGFCVLVLTLTSGILSVAGDTVTLQGSLTNGGKGITADDGTQYTIIPDESIESELSKLEGTRVELTGVTYVSHGRKMITAFSYKIL